MLGRPIAHSLSPVLWREALAELHLDWSYTAVECDEAGLASFLDGVRSDPTWACLSLTMPLKLTVLPLLDEVRTPVGAVNTVLVDGARLVGHNTDVVGVRAAVAATRVPLDDAWVGVLGGGGTARAAVAALAGTGVGQVEVATRTPAHDLVALGEALGVPVRSAPWERAWGLLHAADLVISTTPAGATDLLAADWWRPAGLVEVLYDPWPTPLAASALRAGATVVGGLDVLVGQAVEAIRLATGRGVPAATLRQAGEEALAARLTGARGAVDEG